MSMFDGLLSKLGNAAAEMAERFIPGSAHAIEAAKAIGAAFENVKQLNGGAAPPSAQADHDALFAKVKAHADHTLGRLEGG
jgi:hypothetical protein